MLPIFVVVCYKVGEEGTWLASAARGRQEDVPVPSEFHIIRAIVEGEWKAVSIPIAL